MNKVIYLDNNDLWNDRIKNIRFGKKRLQLRDAEGQITDYIFIVLENTQKHTMIVTAYSRYLFFPLAHNKNKLSRGKKGLRRLKTLDKHAKYIVMFLNYIFFEGPNYLRIKNILDLKQEHGEQFLRDFAAGKIGKSKKQKETVQEVENIIFGFYKHLYKELKAKSLQYINDDDFDFWVPYPSYKPPQRIKGLSLFLISEILKICDLYYPQLKLAICLQAFAGLRRGEVCNASIDKLYFKYIGKELSYFLVDLREKKAMRDDNINVGEIKKKRVQPVYPAFLPVLTRTYNEHMELIRAYDDKNVYRALFLNENGVAMTDKSYGKHLKTIIRILIDRLSKIGDSKSKDEIKKLVSGRIDTHVFRHFFTQYVAKYATSPQEIALFRGDASLESAITYLIGHPMVDDTIKDFQSELDQYGLWRL